jgi:hypothetical protein
MLKRKWTILVVAIATSLLLAPDAFAQQPQPILFGDLFTPIPTAAAKGKRDPRRLPRCEHRPSCRSCCYYPNSGATRCEFDYDWCGR